MSYLNNIEHLFKPKPGRDGQPEPRPATERERWETSPERRKRIDQEHERIGRKVPGRARPGNNNNRRGKNK